ncbi:MAG: flagellar basal body-associated FliL family protein [Pseudomonadota bacterium]
MEEKEKAKEKKIEEEELEKQEAKKGKPLFMWIVIAIAMSVLGGGGFFVWTKFFQTPKPKAATLASQKETVIGPMFRLDTFIVNLAEEQGKRYLKVTMELELENERVQSEVKTRLPQFRDSMLTLLSSKSLAQIENIEGKNRLRDEIIARLNGFLTSGNVKEVYFTEFVIQ